MICENPKCENSLSGIQPISYMVGKKRYLLCSLKCLCEVNPDAKLSPEIYESEKVRARVYPRRAALIRAEVGFETVELTGPFDMELAAHEAALEDRERDFHKSKLFKKTKTDYFDAKRRAIEGLNRVKKQQVKLEQAGKAVPTSHNIPLKELNINLLREEV